MAAHSFSSWAYDSLNELVLLPSYARCCGENQRSSQSLVEVRDHTSINYIATLVLCRDGYRAGPVGVGLLNWTSSGEVAAEWARTEWAGHWVHEPTPRRLWPSLQPHPVLSYGQFSQSSLTWSPSKAFLTFPSPPNSTALLPLTRTSCCWLEPLTDWGVVTFPAAKGDVVSLIPQ
jgi:hypothetical protein